MLEHLKFKAMIEFTARTTDGVNFPTRKRMRSDVQESYYNAGEHKNIYSGLALHSLSLGSNGYW